MRIPTLFFFAAIAALLLPATALAGAACGDGHSAVEHIFHSADTDGNGTLSAAEYEAAGLEGFGVSFADTDADGSGETTLDEYIALYKRHHPGHGAGDEDRVSL